MSFVNHDTREINCKIVYYGPALAGKTTSLEHVYKQAKPEVRGKMISLATETERTISFDFLPLTGPEVRGHKCRFHLYSVPGPVFYDTSRVSILRGVDGIIFVADSQSARAQANVESLESLESNLAIHGYDLETTPMVFQYNKRDLPEIDSVADLDAILNPKGRSRFESSAVRGLGVIEALEGVTKLVVENLRR